MHLGVASCIDQHVLRLEVAVEDAPVVQVLEREREACGVESGGGPVEHTWKGSGSGFGFGFGSGFGFGFGIGFG